MFDANVLTRAATQYGVLGRSQLFDEFGFSRQRISSARNRGVLADVVPGAVRFACSPETFLMRAMAVQLGSESSGYLSGCTAGRLYGLRRMPEHRIHYTTAESFRTSMPEWVVINRCRWFDFEADSHIREDGLVVATPLRMLFALAADFNQYRFERAAEDAWHLRLITPTQAADYLQQHRCRGKDGVSTMERWLEQALNRGRPAQSDLELQLLEAIAEVGLPEPIRQCPLVLHDGSTIHLDIAWPDIQLAVEPGAAWWHGGDLGQRRDQARDRACNEVGWQIVRFDESMRSDPRAAARQVRRIHRRRTSDLRNLHPSSG